MSLSGIGYQYTICKHKVVKLLGYFDEIQTWHMENLTSLTPFLSVTEEKTKLLHCFFPLFLKRFFQKVMFPEGLTLFQMTKLQISSFRHHLQTIIKCC